MVIKVTDRNGKTVTVDNSSKVNGQVKVEGDSPLASHIDRLLNHDLDLPFGGQRSAIDDKFMLKDGSRVILNKASDVYLTEHFIPVECAAFGYTAEIIEE